jgi:hypothetical protein
MTALEATIGEARMAAVRMNGGRTCALRTQRWLRAGDSDVQRQ